jgi:DNA-binding transcriptional LysR family regulator
LHITQPALSKQIIELEQEHRIHLFIRDKRRGLELTDAGRMFAEEASSALLHVERAIHLARATHEGGDRTLMVGHSPSADPSWISAILAVHLALSPKLRIRLTSQFPLELVRSVLASELDSAVVIQPPIDPRITSVSFARTNPYVILPEAHPMASKERITLQDIADDDWIISSKRIHPTMHSAIMDAARQKGIVPRCTHDIMTAQEALYLVSEEIGVAILTDSSSSPAPTEGVVVKPLSDDSLRFETCVIIRYDNDSRLVNGFVRSFLRKFVPQRPLPEQMELLLRA